jgi:hypothetical protein
MKLLLQQADYPLTIIDNEQRQEYIDSIEHALLTEKPDEFYTFVFAAIEKSLDDYLDAVRNSRR